MGVLTPIFSGLEINEVAYLDVLYSTVWLAIKYAIDPCNME